MKAEDLKPGQRFKVLTEYNGVNDIEFMKLNITAYCTGTEALEGYSVRLEDGDLEYIPGFWEVELCT